MIVELSKEDLLLAIGALRYLEAVSRAATGVDDHSAQAQRIVVAPWTQKIWLRDLRRRRSENVDG